MDADLHSVPCPACGGAGGGPFGRAGSAWDDEDYECMRCDSVGVVVMDDLAAERLRPGLAKATPDAAPAVPTRAAEQPADLRKRKASA